MRVIIAGLVVVMMGSWDRAWAVDIVFDGLPWVGASTNSGVVNVNVRMSGDLLEEGDIVRLELFEDSFSDTPFYLWDYDGATDNFGVSYVGGQVDGPAWQDIQGAVRITTLVGSVHVDSVLVRSIVNGNVYENVFIIPEPATLAILLGLLGVVGRRGSQREPRHSRKVA